MFKFFAAPPPTLYGGSNLVSLNSSIHFVIFPSITSRTDLKHTKLSCGCARLIDFSMTEKILQNHWPFWNFCRTRYKNYDILRICNAHVFIYKFLLFFQISSRSRPFNVWTKSKRCILQISWFNQPTILHQFRWNY